MIGLLRTVANVALVVVGFFTVFFAATKIIGQGAKTDTPVAGNAPDADMDLDIGVVHADVPK